MKYLLTTLFLILTLVGISQDFNYGVKAGFNVNNLMISPETDPPKPSVSLGLHAGGTADYSFSDILSVQADITVSSQGANDEDEEEYQMIRLTYLNFPVFVKYKFVKGFAAFAGPQIGYLIHAKFTEEDKRSGEQEIISATNFIKSNDFSFVLGSGYTLNNGLNLTAAYSTGLNDINDDPFEIAIYERFQSLKNRVLQISISYNLNQLF
jgi:hypothetical protein